MDDSLHTTVVRDDAIATALRALGHPARTRILRLLAAQTECRGSELFSELPLAQSTVSEHLRVLKDAGLITSHPVGTGTVYCLVAGKLDEVIESLRGLRVGAVECTPGDRLPDTPTTDHTEGIEHD